MLFKLSLFFVFVGLAISGDIEKLVPGFEGSYLHLNANFTFF